MATMNLKLHKLLRPLRNSFNTLRGNYDPSQIMKEEKCPFCSMLPVERLPIGVEPPVVEYHLSHYEPTLETNDPSFNDHSCSLFRLVRDLYQIWCKNGNGGESKYWFGCSPENFSVCTEPGKPR